MREKIFDRAQRELEALLNISSETGNEYEILRYLEDRFRFMGLQVERQPVLQDRYNLLVNHQPDSLLITAHVDTVPEVIEGQRCARYHDGDLVFGRGAVDVKGSIAASIVAVEQFLLEEDIQETPSFSLAFTVDEERGGKGAEMLAAYLDARAAVVLEPTELQLGVAQSGSLEAQLTVYGSPAHGGEFDMGENAIKRAVEFLESLGRLPFLLERDDLVGPAGFNLQWLRGGQKNALVVPLKCQAVIDFRILPHQDVKTIQGMLEEFADDFGRVEVKYLDVSPSFNISLEEPVVQLFREAGQAALGDDIPLVGIRSWTDAQPLYSAGITPVIFGPGKLAVAHTPYEFVDLKEVVSASRILAETMRRTSMVYSA